MEEIKSITGIISQSQLSGIVSDLVTFIKGQDTNVTNAYKALVGELGKTEGENPVDHTVKSYIDAAIAGVTSDAGELEGRVADAEAAIEKLNGNSEVVDSVDYKITQAFNDFATKVSDDKVVNTFKEMVDYVAAHGTEYTNLAALVGSLPEGCEQTTVVAYAKAMADAAQAEADGRIKAIEDDYLTSADKTELQGNIDACVTAINANALATDAEIAAIKALIA